MPADTGRWTFPCGLVRTIDGDTMLVNIDLGFHLRLTARLRLANINAPEIKTSEGLAAKAAAESWLAAAGPLTCETRRTDEYGRYIAIIAPAAGETLNDYMVRTHFAVPFDIGAGGV